MDSKRHVSTHKIICWRLTRKCNRNCEFCLSSSGPEIHLRKINYEDSIARMHELGVEKISYSGGEPFLYKEIGNAVKFAISKGIKQIVTTNGDVLSVNIPNWIKSLEYLKFSFYGEEAIHDSRMGTGNYHSLFSTIEKINKNHEFNVGANYMLSVESVEGVESFLEKCVLYKIRQVLFLTYIPTGNNCIDDKYKIDEEKDYVAKTLRIIKSYSSLFPGGIKIHDYSFNDYFIVLDDSDRFTLPRNNREDYIMGLLCDEELMHPKLGLVKAKDALNAVWDERLKTTAIQAA